MLAGYMELMTIERRLRDSGDDALLEVVREFQRGYTENISKLTDTVLIVSRTQAAQAEMISNLASRQTEDRAALTGGLTMISEARGAMRFLTWLVPAGMVLTVIILILSNTRLGIP